MDKADIRARVLRQRRDFAVSAAYAPACREICRHIRQLDEYAVAEKVMIYLPLPGEADVTALLTGEKTFFVPVTRDGLITPALYRPDMKLVRGDFGVAEPKEPIFADGGDMDFIIVPAVAADRRGNRLGYGKGCYDRFLDGLGCAKAAAVFSFQLADEIEAEPHDAAMDYIITEGGLEYGKR